MLGDMISQAIFDIMGPTPSRPADFPGSSLRMNSATCDVVISGILKNISDGTKKYHIYIFMSTEYSI